MLTNRSLIYATLPPILSSYPDNPHTCKKLQKETLEQIEKYLREKGSFSKRFDMVLTISGVTN